jgi:plastocyanin
MTTYLKRIKTLVTFSIFFSLSNLVSTTALASPSVHTVTMKTMSFEPKSIQIKSGDTVEWVNQSYSEHSATSDKNQTAGAAFDTGLIQPKKSSKKIEFSKAGTFTYHCSVHGKSMTAEVSVTP